jgi:hypothetical protein
LGPIQPPNQWVPGALFLRVKHRVVSTFYSYEYILMMDERRLSKSLLNYKENSDAEVLKQDDKKYSLQDRKV